MQSPRGCPRLELLEGPEDPFLRGSQQRVGRHPIAFLVLIDLPVGGHQIPEIAAGPDGPGKAVIDVEVGGAQPLAKPAAASVGWILGQIRDEQRLVEANPRQGDQSHRNGHMVVIRGPCDTAGAVGDTTQRTQEAQLVGGTLVVVEDDVPQQRQGAGPVIRQPDRQVRPLDVGPAQVVVCGTLPLDERAVIPGQFPDFIFRDGMESALGSGWAMPQRDREQPTRLEQGNEFSDYLISRPSSKAAAKCWPSKQSIALAPFSFVVRNRRKSSGYSRTTGSNARRYSRL